MDNRQNKQLNGEQLKSINWSTNASSDDRLKVSADAGLLQAATCSDGLDTIINNNYTEQSILTHSLNEVKHRSSVLTKDGQVTIQQNQEIFPRVNMDQATFDMWGRQCNRQTLHAASAQPNSGAGTEALALNSSAYLAASVAKLFQQQFQYNIAGPSIPQYASLSPVTPFHHVQENIHLETQQLKQPQFSTLPSTSLLAGANKPKKTTKSSCPEPFPQKLYRMLDETESQELTNIVSFMPSGKSFRIHDRSLFISQISPKYFNQKNIQSFKRQLSHYDFQLLYEGTEAGAYQHEYFQKGRPDLLHRVRRKGRDTADKKGSTLP